MTGKVISTAGLRLSLFLLLFIAGISCRKGDFKDNQVPDTKIALDAINLTGNSRLNSEVHLSWYGTDIDGYITGYEISLNQQDWFFTASEDSTFIFQLEPGSDTTDINFYVRAIDNEGSKDPSPAYLRVPLKNTPPTAVIDEDRGPKDTAFIASTFFWRANDPDGNETIRQAFMRFNQGDWVEIDKNQSLISFLVDTSVQTGTATAQVYYGKNKQAESFTINGLNVNGNNELYLKVVDLANAESTIDTSKTFFLKNKTPGVNTLWVSGHIASITAKYKGYLDANSIQYDLLNYGASQGAYQPVYWDPTFRLILSQYSRIFVNAPSTKFLNTVTGENTTLLNYIAPMIQGFYNEGHQSFITCNIDKSEDVSNIAGPFPIENIVSSVGQVRIYPDSLVYPVSNPTLYPNLQPTNIQTGVTPIVKSSDSEPFYRAQLTPFGGWAGDNLVGVIRRPGNQLRQVFFAIELHNYDKIPGSVESLIGEIFNNEF